MKRIKPIEDSEWYEIYPDKEKSVDERLEILKMKFEEVRQFANMLLDQTNIV